MEAEILQRSKDLQEKNVELAKANRAKDQFLSNMSHELRSPLHTIIGFSELLAEQIEGALNARQSGFVDNIHRDGLHLLHVVNDILDLSKIESGRFELRRETFDLRAVLDEVLSSVRQACHARRIDIHAMAAANITVFADRVCFKQIVYNLVSNAAKFTPSGGRIEVIAYMLDGFAEISVRDNGSQIDPEELQPFGIYRQVLSGASCDRRNKQGRWDLDLRSASNWLKNTADACGLKDMLWAGELFYIHGSGVKWMAGRMPSVP